MILTGRDGTVGAIQGAHISFDLSWNPSVVFYTGGWLRLGIDLKSMGLDRIFRDPPKKKRLISLL